MQLPQEYTKLTREERREVRNEYMLRQSGKCSHCHEHLSGDPSPEVMRDSINWRLFPGGKDFLRYPVHLHHCHNSGMTIGAVHARCNAWLWQYRGE